MVPFFGYSRIIIPQNKPGKTSCPLYLQKNPNLVQQWLRNAIRRGNFGEFDHEFPRVFGIKKKINYLKQDNRGEVRVNTTGFLLPLMIKS